MKTRTKVLLLVAAGSLALPGCETVRDLIHGEGGGGGVKMLSCSGTCNVWINVTDCSISDPGPISVAKGRSKINWHLTSGRHDFTATGIHFPGGTPSAFSNPSHPQKGVFTWEDNNPGENKKHYKYQIDVVRDGNATVCSIDPDVVNE